jgi:hypothetical protein
MKIFFILIISAASLFGQINTNKTSEQAQKEARVHAVAAQIKQSWNDRYPFPKDVKQAVVKRSKGRFLLVAGKVGSVTREGMLVHGKDGNFDVLVLGMSALSDGYVEFIAGNDGTERYKTVLGSSREVLSASPLSDEEVIIAENIRRQIQAELDQLDKSFAVGGANENYRYRYDFERYRILNQ